MIGLVKVKESFYNLCSQNSVDEELLFNECGRPCVLLVKLTYKGKDRDFVVPLRSNISARTPARQYLSLPPNPTTRPNLELPHPTNVGWGSSSKRLRK